MRYCFCLLLAISSCKPTIPSSTQKTRTLLKAGRYAEAEASAKEAIAAHPLDATARHVQIKTALTQGKFEEAHSYYLAWQKQRNGKHDSVAYREMAILLLRQALHVRSPEIQVQSIEIIHKHQLQEFAIEVKDKLENDNDIVVAAAAIALLRSHPAAPHLASELLQSSDPRARRITTKGIGKKAGEVARSSIYLRLEDKDKQVRRAAVQAIKNWKAERDLPLLAKLATTSPDKRIRATALQAFIGNPSSQWLELAKHALQDTYIASRLSAIAHLSKIESSEVFPILHDLVKGDDISLALAAGVILYKQRQIDPTPLYQKHLKSHLWSQRSLVLNSISRASPRDTALTLSGKALADSRIEVRLTAAHLLLKLGVSTQALKILQDALRSSQRSSRLVAARTLSKRNHHDAILVLSTLASQGEKDQRIAAIFSHSHLKNPTQGLIASLCDQDIEIRLAAIDVLMQLTLSKN